jgi:hypothetical protein
VRSVRPELIMSSTDTRMGMFVADILLLVVRKLVVSERCPFWCIVETGRRLTIFHDLLRISLSLGNSSVSP